MMIKSDNQEFMSKSTCMVNQVSETPQIDSSHDQIVAKKHLDLVAHQVFDEMPMLMDNGTGLVDAFLKDFEVLLDDTVDQEAPPLTSDEEKDGSNSKVFEVCEAEIELLDAYSKETLLAEATVNQEAPTVSLIEEQDDLEIYEIGDSSVDVDMTNGHVRGLCLDPGGGALRQVDDLLSLEDVALEKIGLKHCDKEVTNMIKLCEVCVYVADVNQPTLRASKPDQAKVSSLLEKLGLNTLDDEELLIFYQGENLLMLVVADLAIYLTGMSLSSFDDFGSPTLVANSSVDMLPFDPGGGWLRLLMISQTIVAVLVDMFDDHLMYLPIRDEFASLYLTKFGTSTKMSLQHLGRTLAVMLSLTRTAGICQLIFSYEARLMACAFYTILASKEIIDAYMSERARSFNFHMAGANSRVQENYYKQQLMVKIFCSHVAAQFELLVELQEAWALCGFDCRKSKISWVISFYINEQVFMSKLIRESVSSGWKAFKEAVTVEIDLMALKQEKTLNGAGIKLISRLMRVMLKGSAVQSLLVLRMARATHVMMYAHSEKFVFDPGGDNLILVVLNLQLLEFGAKDTLALIIIAAKLDKCMLVLDHDMKEMMRGLVECSYLCFDVMTFDPGGEGVMVSGHDFGSRYLSRSKTFYKSSMQQLGETFAAVQSLISIQLMKTCNLGIETTQDDVYFDDFCDVIPSLTWPRQALGFASLGITATTNHHHCISCHILFFYELVIDDP